MTDLKERFALVDEVDSRDLWGEARRRASAPEALRRAIEWPPGAGRRLAAAAVALAVFATATVFAWQLSHPADGPLPPPRPAEVPVDLATELGPGWSELPAPPEVRRRAATEWTGSRLIVWGGFVFDGGGDKTPSDGGFIFDAGSRTWGPMPPGPLSARSYAASAWTGSELLIWGGFSGDCCVPSEMFLDDGAAFDPATGRWRVLPASPLSERAPFSVWTGRELIVWGSRDRTVRHLDGAAYYPDTNTWRPIADGPIELTDGSAVWTGEEMIVFGAALNGNNHAETVTDIGAAYDPTTDRWRKIADSPLSPQAATAAWPGSGEMIAWDYDQATAAYDPGSDTWRDLPRVPLQFAECYPRSVAISGHVFGDFCGGSVTFSAAEDHWTKITRDEVRGWVTEPVAAGSAFLVMAHPLELSDESGVTFDTKMFAYVPPGEVAQPSTEEEATPFVPATQSVADEIRMPVVFPDGTRATLVFPSELGLEEMGVQPDVSYLYREDAGPESLFEIIFLHDPNASIRTYVDGLEPITTIDRGPEIWMMSDEWDARNQLQGVWIRLRLESWTVLVASTTVEQAVSVADYLRLRETPSGFPLVEAVGPLALAEGFGETEGAVLGIADTYPDPNESPAGEVIFLSPDGCNGETSVSGKYGSLCLANVRIFASIYGDRTFVRAVVGGLRVEDFRPA
jgi:hypothetical protein